MGFSLTMFYSGDAAEMSCVGEREGLPCANENAAFPFTGFELTPSNEHLPVLLKMPLFLCREPRSSSQSAAVFHARCSRARRGCPQPPPQGDALTAGVPPLAGESLAVGTQRLLPRVSAAPCKGARPWHQRRERWLCWASAAGEALAGEPGAACAAHSRFQTFPESSATDTRLGQSGESMAALSQ